MHCRESNNQRATSNLCGISARIAAGALGIRLELNDGLEGMSARKNQACGVANFDVLKGERKDRKNSWITSHNHEGGDQGLPAPGVSAMALEHGEGKATRGRGGGFMDGTEVFGSLKAVLETIFSVYVQHEVRLKPPPNTCLSRIHLQGTVAISDNIRILLWSIPVLEALFAKNSGDEAAEWHRNKLLRYTVVPHPSDTTLIFF